jgi:hypothetical protein
MSHATCFCVLDDGRRVAVHATCRARAERVDIKAHGSRRINARIQQILRLARHSEAEFDSRVQVVISLDPWPDEASREWELALVLADRMARGLYHNPAQELYAHGWSDHWHEARIAPVTAAQLARYASLADRLVTSPANSPPASACLITGQIAAEAAATETGGGDGQSPAQRPNDLNHLFISHLGALHGHPDPLALISTSRTWFPLYSAGQNDSLNWVEVSVRPLATSQNGEAPVSVVGLDAAQSAQVQQVLADARQFDGKPCHQWRTVVRFGHDGFYGESYQFALVMADRIARGRDFPARGRLIATGRSGAWHSGMVERVEAVEAKCALLLHEVQRGDRLLLPAAWQDELPPKFMAQVAAKGGSCACVERIGLL